MLLPEITIILSQLQSKCNQLHTAQWVRRSNLVLLFIFLLLGGVGLAYVLFGPVLRILALALVILIFVRVLYWRCIDLPTLKRIVWELNQLAMKFGDEVEALKKGLEFERNSTWFPSMHKRWQHLEELGKKRQDVKAIVETLSSVVNSYLISQLTDKLKECKEHLSNI